METLDGLLYAAWLTILAMTVGGFMVWSPLFALSYSGWHMILLAWIHLVAYSPKKLDTGTYCSICGDPVAEGQPMCQHCYEWLRYGVY